MKPARASQQRDSAPPAGAPVDRVVADASRRLALRAAEAGLDKKAIGVEIIDVVGKVDYADYLVLMTGTSDRHVSSIARSVDEELSKAGHPPMSVEGLPRGEWVLLDFVDVVVHVFAEDARSLYDLDGLWMDAGRIPLPDSDRGEPGPGTE
ncbi:MAG: ribosome silencing factor [Myxococcales bacterium]|jgi:ribosome-associated protein|nr:ribosome silencing factor [Myxococcales bacterium]